MRRVLTLTLCLAVGLLATACGGTEKETANTGTASSGVDIVVTTNILGDIVRNVVGDQASVQVLMPVGVDPHDFALSAKQADAMGKADLVVTNGAGIEAKMSSVITRVAGAGVPVFTFADHVTMRGDDPHIWTDPLTIEPAVRALGTQIATLAGVDPARLAAQAAAYAESLIKLDESVRATLAPIPSERRVLVTNHEVFDYFAERYDLQVLGAVVPSLTTDAQASAKEIESLAATIREHHVPAIFAETTKPTKLADALAKEVGSTVKVVELYTESLGKPGSAAATYVDMVQTNADLIANALGG